MSKLTLRGYYPSPIYLDDEETGKQVKVTVHIKRLTEAEYPAFRASMTRMNEPWALRLLGGRKQETDETEKDDKDRYVISEPTIWERRIAELESDARVRYEAAVEEDEVFSRAFIVQAGTDFISVPEGEIDREDGTPLTAGRDLIERFAGRSDVLRQLMVAIWVENTVSAAAKKVLRSQSDSQRSLVEHLQDLAGGKRGAIAPSVVTVGSAETADAMASIEGPSGSLTATSSSTSAPSDS